MHGRVGFFATKKIQPGEELSYLRDPNATTRAKYSSIKCMCGAKKCRGFI